MARPIYQYKPIKNTNIKPIGISLPFNQPGAKKSIGAAYDASFEDAGSVFVQTYSTEEQAISNIKNLFMTVKGERYMQPNFGTILRTLLFEQNVDDLQDRIVEALEADIGKWLPYITINGIEILQPEHELIIRVRFKVTNIGANLVINILANENTFTVGEALEDIDTVESELTQINTGVY
jgi:phage baseplate assembly protein W